MNELLEFINSKLELIYILILAIFIGVELIKNVPSVLHTPLMSGANALSGVVIVGALLVMLQADPENYLALGLGFVAVVLGIINVVGGFAVTDRCYKCLKRKNNEYYIKYYLLNFNCYFCNWFKIIGASRNCKKRKFNFGCWYGLSHYWHHISTRF